MPPWRVRMPRCYAVLLRPRCVPRPRRPNGCPATHTVPSHPTPSRPIRSRPNIDRSFAWDAEGVSDPKERGVAATRSQGDPPPG
eukprot:gene18765-biopygen14503